MPTVESVTRKIDTEGETVTFTRNTEFITWSATVKAFVRGYAPDELGGGINQGDRVLIVSPAALLSAGFPDDPHKPDQVSIPPDTVVVQTCETRKLRGRAAMYVIQVRGG